MPMRWARRAACLASALAVSPLPALAAGSCASLHGLSIPDLTIGQAADVAAGSFTPATAPALKLDVPAFCRVAATATPTPDSQIGLEVWVPSGGAWNGKLLGIGNGGYSSVLDYPAMADGIRRGYATVATDDGHTGEDLRFVIGHPGKAADWADRAIHAMTVAAKPVLRAYAGRLPERSYFAGCSTGGFQGLAEAQRYPEDYDGIIAGAPGYPRFNLSASFMYAWAVNHDAAGKEILTRPKLPTLNKAVTAACAGPDGVIADPRQCHFDPASLLCTGAETDGCLTAAQVAVVRAVYRGPENARTHQSVFPGWDPGSEALGGDPKAGWTAYIVGQPEPVRLELWKYWAFGDPNFDYRSFDYDRDLDYADRAVPSMNAVSTDLHRFQQRGGKLLMYYGWADNVSSARTGIDYYESLQRTVGDAAKTRAFSRLFLLPGVGHCSGGPGPDSFDAIGALDSWVEQGTAPDRLVASHSSNGAVDRSRPLCPYPQIARWDGSGDRNVAASYTCATDPQAPPPDDGAWLQHVQAVDAAVRGEAGSAPKAAP